VVVLSLLGIVFCLVSGFVVHAMATYSQHSTSHLVQSDLRYVMDYMVRELREAISVTAIAQNPSKITYTTIQNGATVTRYFRLQGTTIQRHDNEPLCQYVQSVLFFYDSATARVTITLESVVSPAGAVAARGLPYRLHTSVALRNALQQ